MEHSNGHAVYELNGVSLSAAQGLEQEIVQRMAAKQANPDQDVDPIDFNILQETGLKSASVCVYQAAQSFPRAYEKRPEIFTTPEANSRYIMFAPIDYKGDHFTPNGGRQLDKKESDAIGNLLFAGGWLGNSPIMPVRDRGVALPDDYIDFESGNLTQNFAKATNDKIVFLARGQTLALIQDRQSKEDSWKNAINKTIEAIKADIMAHKTDILAALPDGEDIYVNSGYGYQRNSNAPIEITVSVRREGKIGMLMAGQPVALPASLAYTATSKHNSNDYIITPRRDTAEGQAIAALFDAIPQTPSLTDYPELQANYEIESTKFGHLFGENGKIPQLHTLGDNALLIYTASPSADKTAFCPPDAIEIPAKVYNWVKSDAGDRNMGIMPPPAPAEVLEFDLTPELPAAPSTLPNLQPKDP